MISQISSITVFALILYGNYSKKHYNECRCAHILSSEWFCVLDIGAKKWNFSIDFLLIYGEVYICFYTEAGTDNIPTNNQ